MNTASTPPLAHSRSPLRYGLFLLSLVLLALSVAGCGSGKKPAKPRPSVAAPSKKPIQISHISAAQGGPEIALYAMGLIGTPYKYGGNSTSTGFDCSGLITYVYSQALTVSLPRTATDLAFSSRSIKKSQLKAGDLVFFNTSGNNPYSHVGIYIGDNQFVHAPSSNGTIRTASLDNPYFAPRFSGARTFFAR
ncbi:MAG: C40 family peptidase [Neisseriaceae bacterium]|nr:C40 family peptidase [Neisseriaceae bacterium]